MGNIASIIESKRNILCPVRQGQYIKSCVFCLVYLLRRPEAPFYAAQVTIYAPNPTLVLEEEEGYYVQKWAEDGQNQPNVDFSGEKILPGLTDCLPGYLLMTRSGNEWILGFGPCSCLCRPHQTRIWHSIEKKRQLNSGCGLA